MKRNLLISALLSTVAAFAGEQMSVAVCNVGELPAQVIERAGIRSVGDSPCEAQTE